MTSQENKPRTIRLFRNAESLNLDFNDDEIFVEFIEYSAFEQLKKENDKLTKALKVAEEAMSEIKYQCMRTYNTCDPDNVDDLSPAMPLGLILRALAETKKMKGE